MPQSWNPCFCFDVQKGLQIISVVQLIRSVGTLIFASVLMTYVAVLEEVRYYPDPHGDATKHPGYAIALLTFFILLGLFQGVLAIYLWLGAVQRNHPKCRLWFCSTLVFWLLNFILLITIVSIAPVHEAAPVVFAVIFLLVDFYCLVVVFSFLAELTSDPNSLVIDS